MADTSACCCPFSGFNYCPGSPPVNASGPAICSAACATTGTLDTVNSLVTGASNLISGIFKTKQQQQATAVKAQVQLAQTKANTTMVIFVAIIAVVGFLIFAGNK